MIEVLSVVCSVIICLGIYDYHKWEIGHFRAGEWFALAIGAVCIFVGIYSLFYLLREGI